jgi:hypothetical protein
MSATGKDAEKERFLRGEKVTFSSATNITLPTRDTIRKLEITSKGHVNITENHFGEWKQELEQGLNIVIYQGTIAQLHITEKSD